MKVIEPSAYLQTPENEGVGLACLRKIELMARISHKSEEAQTEDSWKRLLTQVVLSHGDWSVTEHASATAIFEVNRGITHEAVRHRLFSPTQESTRFVNYTQENHEPRYCPSVMVKPEDLDEWMADLQIADNIYRKWIGRGYAPQIARDHLPHALAATIGVTGNFRNWRWFFLARTTKETHPDMRAVSIPLLKQFQERIPLLYDDIEPLQKQSISMAKTH